jgi:WD40 repeat protein/energy-coupling factor transporter ATP-binding protein EcfA2
MLDDGEYQHELFVSHASSDEAWVKGYLLSALGLNRDRVITPKSFRIGASTVGEIERAVAASRYTLLVLSPAYLADEWARFSDHLVSYVSIREQQDRLIPLMLKPCVLPLGIDFRVRLNCTDPSVWESEIARVRELLSQGTPPNEQIPCPYPGMKPFRSDNAPHFYGRDEEIDDLIRRLRNHQCVFVIGSSGAGKSSLVFAGLLPRLKRSSFFPSDYWLTRNVRPGDKPLENFVRAVEGDLIEPLQRVTDLLAAHPPAKRLLLVIDQLEELFAVTESGKEGEELRFIAALQVLRKAPNCTIVATMRAGFYQDLMASDLWPVDSSERLEIVPLSGERLRQAIQGPAEDAGVYLEAGLTERLLVDGASEPGVLPLMQETMVLLWEKRLYRLVPLAAYTGLGRGELSGLAVAIAQKADAAMASLSPIQQAIARRVFLRLIHFGLGRPDTRRQQPMTALCSAGEDPTDFNQTLNHLIESRLLTSTAGESETDQKLDLAHETLIRGWPTLQRWAKERREAEQSRRRLEIKAEEWVRLNRTGGLLDAVELVEADRWLSTPDASELGYSPYLQGLVQASRAAIESANRENEVIRQRELAQARALATEQKRRAEEQGRQAKRFQRLARALAGVLLLAIVAGFFGWIQRGRAQYQSRVSASRELAQAAISQLTIDPELSVLVAAEAARTAHTEQAQDALREALLESHVRVLIRSTLGELAAVAVSRDGTKVFMGSDDGTAELWDRNGPRKLWKLRAHTDRINGAAFSPNNEKLVTASSDKTARVWDVATGKVLVVLRGHAGELLDALFSPDSNSVLTESPFEHTTKLWNVRSGKAILTRGHLPQRLGPLSEFSHDGKLVATSAGKTMEVWEAATGRTIAVLSGHSDAVFHGSFSPDDKWLVTASGDTTARVWEIRTGKTLAVLRGHSKMVTTAIFSPNGRLVATACAALPNFDAAVRLWDPSTGRTIAILAGHTHGVIKVAFSADSKFVLTASYDNTARVWEAATGKAVAVLRGHTSAVYDAVFSDAEKLVVTAGADGTARVWDAGTGQSQFELDGHTEAVLAAAFTEDRKTVVTVARDETVRLWDARSGRCLHVQRIGNNIDCTAFSRDAKRIITVYGSTAKVWDVGGGRNSVELVGHTGQIVDAAFSKDTKKVVTASLDGSARVWDVASGSTLAVLRGHTKEVRSVAFSPDGKFVATGSSDGTARVWDAVSGTSLAVLRGHKREVTGVAFSPDGEMVGSASDDETLRVWSARTWESSRELTGSGNDKGTFTGIRFSPDGKYVLAGDVVGAAYVWEVRTGRLVVALLGHERGASVQNAGFSPDGRFVVTAGGAGGFGVDLTARVWQVPLGAPVAVLRGHTEPLTSAAFSPDGKFVITTSEDKTARIYRCELCDSIEDLLSLAPSRVTRRMTREECQRYLHVETCPPGP